MSQISDSSSRTLDGLAHQSSTSQSTAALGSSGVGGATKKLKFNEHGLPIGENSAKCSSRLGDLSRTHIPVRFTSWPKVPKCYKDQLWNAYKAEYPDVKDCQRGLFMRKACGAWRKFKGKLRQNLVGDDVTKWKKYVPNNVKSEDWEAYCDHEATQSQKEVRKRNKAIKDNSEKKSTHNTGRNGYARAAEKWENENGRPPTRAELWLYTHQKKDGTYAPHDKEFAEKVEMLLKVHKGKSGEETLDSDPISEVFGKDTRGSVRCVGSTVSRRSLLASAFAREMLKEVNKERDNWMEEVGTLKKDMDNVKSTLTDFISDFKSRNFVTDDTDDNTPISPATPTSDNQFSSFNDLTPHGIQSHVNEIPGYSGCEIRAHTNELVGYGRKAKLGAVISVHGRQLGTREVPVILDKILVPGYLIWGGKQGHCSTLADVGTGGFMCWHDDYLPPLEDTQ